jgi:hypothetical protein
MPSNRMHPAKLGVLSLFLASCGTEPNANLVGAWSLTATYGGGDVTCTVLATLTLEGSGSSLTGTLAEEAGTCSDGGTEFPISPDTFDVIGTVDGRDVGFTPQPPEGQSPCSLFRFEGRVSGDRMSGAVRTIPVFCQGTYVEMNGTWQAERSSNP